jgi:acetate---CoA ligase (ADP-forming)
MLHASNWIAPERSAPRSVVAINDLPTGSLDEAQAKQLFARFGVPCVRERVVQTAVEAENTATEFSGNVVLKILSNIITHKSDVGGVAVNVAADQISARFATMVAEVEHATGEKPSRFLVQEMIRGGTELILGMHRDPLGTAILLGMGGVNAELFEDTVLCMMPVEGGLTRDEALKMARSLKTWPLLDGFRGRPTADVEALVSAIVAFSHMVAQLGDTLLEAEINPIFVLEKGRGVRAADGVAVFKG